MSPQEREVLETCRSECVIEFERLIRKMSEAGCTKLVLNDHPDYGYCLGVGAADVDLAKLDPWVECIANYWERFAIDEEDEEDDDESTDIESYHSWDWFRECWIAAKGLESGKTVVLFANGIGDMMDLNTGEEPDEELGIRNLIWP